MSRADRFWSVIFVLTRIALGGIFIAAALPKMWRPDQFADAINNYRVLPYFLVNANTLALPWVEFLFGAFLVAGFRVRAASLATTIMMAVFLAAILSAWARGIDITCGCFGTQDAAKTGGVTLLRDLGFLALAILGYPWGGLRPGRAPAPVV